MNEGNMLFLLGFVCGLVLALAIHALGSKILLWKLDKIDEEYEDD